MPSAPSYLQVLPPIIQGEGIRYQFKLVHACALKDVS